MSGNYYYFVSSLPYLRPGEEPPLSSEEFLAQARQQLTSDDFECIEPIVLEPTETTSAPALTRWNAFEISLRNVVAGVRASRQKREAQPFLRPEPDAFGGLESQVQDALSRDPLTMEQQLDRIRWQFLDSLTVGQEFGLATIIVYRIKLLLQEKLSGVSAEQGQERLEQLMDAKLTSDQLPEFIHG